MLNRVLVVDDSDLIHKMYKFFLKRYRGCEIASTRNGREALDRLEESTDFDVILLDINMPVMNGIEFLKAVQGDERFRHIPVIIISTEGREEDTIRGIQLGAKGYLVKPFNATNLTQVIESVVGGSGGAGGVSSGPAEDGRGAS